MQAVRAFPQTCLARPAKKACWTTAAHLFFYRRLKRATLLTEAENQQSPQNPAQTRKEVEDYAVARHPPLYSRDSVLL
jgi:hypothetical protein